MIGEVAGVGRSLSQRGQGDDPTWLSDCQNALTHLKRNYKLGNHPE